MKVWDESLLNTMLAFFEDWMRHAETEILSTEQLGVPDVLNSMS